MQERVYGSGRDREALLEGLEDGGDAVGESYDGGADGVKTGIDVVDEGLEDLDLVAGGCEGLDNASRCVLVEVGTRWEQQVMTIPFDSAGSAARYAEVFPDWAELSLAAVIGEKNGASAHS